MNIGADIARSEAAQLFQAAADHQVPVQAAVLHQSRWLSFTGPILEIRNKQVFFELPKPIESHRAEDVLVGTLCHMDFRIDGIWYFFEAHVEGPTHVRKPLATHRALSFTLPERLHGVDRRLVRRYDLTHENVVRAAICPGASAKPVWTGRVTNLSIGGLQMRCLVTALGFFAPGDQVQAKVWLEPHSEPLQMQANYRRGLPDGAMALLSFQFAQASPQPETQAAMEALQARLERLSRQ